MSTFEQMTSEKWRIWRGVSSIYFDFIVFIVESPLFVMSFDHKYTSSK